MHRLIAVSDGRQLRFEVTRGRDDRKEAEMKTPIVRETRRAGQALHRSQVALVRRSLLALPERRVSWDERTRTEVSRAA
jgi:hypothetical protein